MTKNDIDAMRLQEDKRHNAEMESIKRGELFTGAVDSVAGIFKAIPKPNFRNNGRPAGSRFPKKFPRKETK